MTEAMESMDAEAKRQEIVITRVFNAPREAVWRAWTDAKQVAQWWGPECFTNPVCEVDARPGGAIYIVMRAPDGAEYPMRGTFDEIVEPERIVFSSVALGGDGKPLLEALATVTLADLGGKTKLTLEASAVALDPIAIQMIGGMEAGWTQSLECLAAHLESGTESDS